MYRIYREKQNLGPNFSLSESFKLRPEPWCRLQIPTVIQMYMVAFRL